MASIFITLWTKMCPLAHHIKAIVTLSNVTGLRYQNNVGNKFVELLFRWDWSCFGLREMSLSWAMFWMKDLMQTSFKTTSEDFQEILGISTNLKPTKIMSLEASLLILTASANLRDQSGEKENIKVSIITIMIIIILIVGDNMHSV